MQYNIINIFYSYTTVGRKTVADLLFKVVVGIILEELMELKYISWLPAFFLMIIIFWFSSKTADQSAQSSTMIADSIMNVYENIADQQFEVEVRVEKIGVIDHVVRKSAHFTEYLILAMAFVFHFILWRKSGWKLFFWSVGLTAFYAASDEFHQLFVTGRGAQFRDVLIDTAGAITGFLIFCLIRKHVTKNKVS